MRGERSGLVRRSTSSIGHQTVTVRAVELTLVISGHIADSTITGCPATAATVPADYLGLSIEWSMVKVWLGADSASVITPSSTS
jgi:hypothetical protein